MARKRVSLSGECGEGTPLDGLTEKQREYADHLAAGKSQRQVAKLCGTTQQNISWLIKNKPEFVALIQELRAELMASQRPLFESTVALSQELVFGALAGEYDPDDSRVELAREVLSRTVWRIVEPGHTPIPPQRQLPPGGDAA